MKKILITAVLFLLFVFSFQDTVAQERFRYGLLPKVELILPIQGDFALRLNAESRQIFFSGNSKDGVVSAYNHERTDITFTVEKGFFFGEKRLKLTAGLNYKMRFGGDGSIIYELEEQFIMNLKFEETTFINRLEIDQVFFPDSYVQLKFWYRFGVVTNLYKRAEGSTEGVDRVYFTCMLAQSVSLLRNLDFEARLTPAIGIGFDSRNRAEFGIAIYANGFIQNKPSYYGSLTLSWSHTLPTL